MQPIIGSIGTAIRFEMIARPPSSGIWRATIASVNPPSSPKPGSQTLQLRTISMLRIVTRIASPGWAPSTKTGPVTRLNDSSQIGRAHV